MTNPYEQLASQDFAARFHYDGPLGALYTEKGTEFRLWAPTAGAVKVILYSDGEGGAGEPHTLQRDVKGTWSTTMVGDLHGVYYTYEVTVNGTAREGVDPYARACGVNGKRGMVVDLARTNPLGWKGLKRPAFKRFEDAVICELHLRDISIHPESGITAKGRFHGLAEHATRGPGGVKTGLDHLQELGVTHVHLLPCFDFATVDEKRPDKDYNWGYDPLHYNIPEGSYASDPTRGEVRIREMKDMILALKRSGIRVIMDVVYNHTYHSEDSHLNRMVPGYYYRQLEDGSFANGSGCGNELASERSMVRRYIVDSVVYWAEEYKIDGFRFDLMGLLDMQTMNEIRRSLDAIDPSLLLYGEGWTGGLSPLPDEQKALKGNIAKMPGIAAFNDDMRDGLKGHVFEDASWGFAQGAPELTESVKFGIVGAVSHLQVNYDHVRYAHHAWAAAPNQAINYAESHDNLTLWDKLDVTVGARPEEERIRMVKLVMVLLFTSQGIPFFQAGMEFLRTKGGEHNSYKAPDRVNQIDWERKHQYKHVFDYARGLIEIRKKHRSLRMTDPHQIQNGLHFLADMPASVIAYTIDGTLVKDAWKKTGVLVNARLEAVVVSLPTAGWREIVNGTAAGVIGQTWSGREITVPAQTGMLLVHE